MNKDKNNHIENTTTLRKSGTKHSKLQKPKYSIKCITEYNRSGWLIELLNKHVSYRIVSGIEQVVEKDCGYMYLCIIVKGCINIGFRFKSFNHVISHSVDKVHNKFYIKLLVDE